MDQPVQLMPAKLSLGSHYNSVMAQPMGRRKDWLEAGAVDPLGRRVVMGFPLPTWQRPLVWTERQKVSFIESAWKGLSLGTYTYNEWLADDPLDMILIDGQQRMAAIEDYVSDKFPVFGYRFSEITVVDRRRWEMTTIFASYVTRTNDEQYLKDYYNLTNFGGTAHKESERA